MSTYKLYKVEVPEEHEDRWIAGPYASALVRDGETVAFTSWRTSQTKEDNIQLARRLYNAYSYINISHLYELGDRELIDTFER